MNRFNAPLIETVRESFTNILVQGRRSALALLGILIGTASIVSMLTIGNIAQQETLKLFNKMGVDMLQVQAAPIGAAPAWLDRAVIETLPSSNPTVAAATPISIGRTSVANGPAIFDIPIVGATPPLFDMAGLALDRGRLLRGIDEGSFVAIAGEQAAAKLSTPGAQLQPGSSVRIASYIFTIVGILKPNPATALDPADYGNALIVPLASGRRVIEAVAPSAALIRLKPGVDVTAAIARIVAQLSSPAAVIQVQTARGLIQTMNAQKAVHSRLLLAIGAISLLVGGIGVMNVMMMAVMERRAEIGLRAAIGASPRDLQAMFVIEAGALALIGGLAGAVIGVAIAFGTARASGWAFSLPVFIVPLGAGTATLVGIVFGLYPAITASRLDPIEALRAA